VVHRRRKNFRFATRRSVSSLQLFMRPVRGTRRPRDGFFLRAESYFNVATEIEQLGVGHNYGGVSLHEQSHGESFLALANHRFGGNGLYILDEPEAALSPQRQLTLLSIINDLVEERASQFTRRLGATATCVPSCEPSSLQPSTWPWSGHLAACPDTGQCACTKNVGLGRICLTSLRLQSARRRRSMRCFAA
jgi:hypothetical protein